MQHHPALGTHVPSFGTVGTVIGTTAHELCSTDATGQSQQQKLFLAAQHPRPSKVQATLIAKDLDREHRKPALRTGHFTRQHEREAAALESEV